MEFIFPLKLSLRKPWTLRRRSLGSSRNLPPTCGAGEGRLRDEHKRAYSVVLALRGVCLRSVQAVSGNHGSCLLVVSIKKKARKFGLEITLDYPRFPSAALSLLQK